MLGLTPAAGACRRKEGRKLIRTITVGSCISVQGMFERDMGVGHIAVRVGDQTYVGKPVKR